MQQRAELAGVDGAPRPGRQWGRTPQARAEILAAAETVFVKLGYAQANIADVVAGSGSTVGSMYHHFGGKAELFLAVWARHERALTDAAGRAVTRARSRGEDDAIELFVIGARAYLERAWTERDRVRLFVGADTPPGFDAVQRERGNSWVRQNSRLLQIGDGALDHLYAGVLTSIVGQGAREVCGCESRRDARRIIDAVLDYIRKLAA